jgi:hypothetical protein
MPKQEWQSKNNYNTDTWMTAVVKRVVDLHVADRMVVAFAALLVALVNVAVVVIVTRVGADNLGKK